LVCRSTRAPTSKRAEIWVAEE